MNGCAIKGEVCFCCDFLILTLGFACTVRLVCPISRLDSKLSFLLFFFSYSCFLLV